MAYSGIGFFLCIKVLYISASTVTLEQSSTGTVSANSSISYRCTTDYNMRFVYFYDEKASLTLASVILANASGTCSQFSVSAGYSYQCMSPFGPYIFTIDSLTDDHQGKIVRCVVQYGSSSTNDIASAEQNIEFTSDQNNSEINVGAIIGGVIGAVIFLPLVCFILYRCFRKEVKADQGIVVRQVTSGTENVNTKTKDVLQGPAQRHFHKALDYCKKHYNIDPFDENVSLTIVKAVNELIERIEKRNFSMIQSAAVNLNLEYKAKDLSSEIPIIFWKCFKANMTFIGITVKSDDEKRAMSLLNGNEEVSIHVTEMFKHKCTGEELINFFITIHEVNTNLFWKLIGEIQPHDRVKIYAQILVLKENSKI